MSKRDFSFGVVGAIGLALLLIFITTPKQQPQTNNLANQIINQPTNTASSSGQLKAEDLTVGSGREVKTGDTAVLNYVGTLENGTKFDSSYDRNQPITIQIGTGQVIKGWDQGIPGMKVGGKRRLTIPPDLGYGAAGAGDKIPPNSTLIFEVELVDIK